MNRLSTATLAAQNIAVAKLLLTHTATTGRELLITLSLSGLAGDGMYHACLTRQIGGAGAAYQTPTAQIYVAATVTTADLQTYSVAVATGDVVKAYVWGTGLDVSVGAVVEVFDCAAGLIPDSVTGSVGSVSGDTKQTGDAFLRLGAPAGASVSADIGAVKTQVADIETDTGTTLDTLIKDVPTVAEFNARTLVAANYFDPAVDEVAKVTLVATTTTNTDMRGTNSAALAATALSNAVWTDTKAGFVDASIDSRSTFAGGAVASVSGNVAGTVGGIAGTLQSLDALWAKVQKWLRLALRKDAAVVFDHAAELVEINVNSGSGGGNYLSTTDSQEGIRDTAPLGTAMRGTDGAAVAGAQMDLVNAPNATAVLAIQNGLATAASQTTILARIGAWTGSGINTLLGAFRALLSKAATAPTDIGGTFTPATDSTEAIRDSLPAAAPTAGAVADAVWDEAMAGHVAPGSAGAALSAASTADDPWITPLPGAYAPGTAGEIIGNFADTVFPAGAIEYAYTVTDSVTLLPIEGVEVWFSTDAAGVNVVWAGVTDAFGVARDVLLSKPWLDAGTYRVWRQRVGYAFANPDVEVVS